MERRLTLRQDQDGVDVIWFALSPPRKRKRRRRDDEPSFHEAELEDLSLTGAGLLTDPSEQLVEGTTIGLDWNDQQSLAIVRRVDGVERACHLGVEFLDPSHEFLILVEQHLPALRARTTEAYRPDWDGRGLESEAG